jgi:ketosteroid isomerase-like protein
VGLLLDHVRSYYAALSSGDADLVASHFTPDAVHYYTRLGPHRGAGAIATNAQRGVDALAACWELEHAVEGADEVAIEWTMAWTDPKSGERRLDRGAEFLAFRDGLICEVRAYHHGGPKNPRGDLVGFDHAARGHTMPD